MAYYNPHFEQIVMTEAYLKVKSDLLDRENRIMALEREVDYLRHKLVESEKISEREAFSKKLDVLFDDVSRPSLAQLVDEFVKYTKKNSMSVGNVGRHCGRVQLFKEDDKIYFSVAVFFQPNDREVGNVTSLFDKRIYKITSKTIIDKDASEIPKRDKPIWSTFGDKYLSFTRLTIQDVRPIATNSDLHGSVDLFLRISSKYNDLSDARKRKRVSSEELDADLEHYHKEKEDELKRKLSERWQGQWSDNTST